MRQITRRQLCGFLAAALLAAPAHRAPAPIQENQENPPPAASPPSAWSGEAFPETRTRLLNATEVRSWDLAKLRYAINELYARGGYDFQSPEIKKIFLHFSWYRERLVNGRSQDEAVAHLSSLERNNLELLQKIRGTKP